MGWMLRLGTGILFAAMVFSELCGPMTTHVAGSATFQVEIGEQITGTCGVPAPFSVTFIPTVTGGVPPYSFSWTFGDGSPNDTSESPTHTYRSAGPFTANVSVSDAMGGHANHTQIVANAPPGCPIPVYFPGPLFALAAVAVSLVLVTVWLVAIRTMRRRRPGP